MSRLIKVLSSIAILSLIFNTPSFAEGKRSGSYTNRAGKTGSWEKSIDRNKGNAEKNIRWKNARGGEGSSEVKKNWDKESKSGTSSRTTTNAQGGVWHREAQIVTDGEGGATRSVTQTNPKGETRTWWSGITVQPGYATND
jgi:hypothetical protein